MGASNITDESEGHYPEDETELSVSNLARRVYKT